MKQYLIIFMALVLNGSLLLGNNDKKNAGCDEGFSKVEPIHPDNIEQAKKESLPDGVILAINKLLKKKWRGSSAKILQSEARDAIAKELKISISEVYEFGYLSFEPAFRAIGWVVNHNKPIGYGGENFSAYYEFKKK